MHYSYSLVKPWQGLLLGQSSRISTGLAEYSVNRSVKIKTFEKHGGHYGSHLIKIENSDCVQLERPRVGLPGEIYEKKQYSPVGSVARCMPDGGRLWQQ